MTEIVDPGATVSVLEGDGEGGGRELNKEAV